MFDSRRDGSPFMNLLMCAPLLDSRGTLRYFIGAQIDVTGLVKDGTDLEAFQALRREQETGDHNEEAKDEFQELCKMFNHAELDLVRKHGGNMHREQIDDPDDASITQHKPRLLIQDQSTFDHVEEGQKLNPKADGRLSGPYKHVRTSPVLSRPIITNAYNSTSSSALPHPSASSSPPPPFVYPASSNPNSSTASAAATACAPPSATPLQMARAA